MAERLSFVFRELLDVRKPQSGDRMQPMAQAMGLRFQVEQAPIGGETHSPQFRGIPSCRSEENRAEPSPLRQTYCHNPEIERKGDANPYTSLNGNMFTLLHQSRLAIRLPGNEGEEFLKKYKTSLFEAYGTVIKE